MRATHPVRVAFLSAALAGSLLASYTFHTVDFPGQPLTALVSINAGGQIVGLAYQESLSVQLSFLTNLTGHIGSSFQYPGANYTHSTGIDNAGSVIGQFVISPPNSGVFLRSSGGTFKVLPPPLALPSGGTPAISGNGAIALSSGASIYLRQPGGSYISFAVPGANSSSEMDVQGIDNTGNIVGFYFPSFGTSVSFFRSAGGVYQTILVPGSVYTEVQGMNNLGQAVGFWYDGTASHGFLWLGGNQFTEIDPPGATSTFASGINDSGVIVGFYLDASEVQHGFIALPSNFSPPPISETPAPPSLWLGVSGCLAMMGYWLRRKRRLS